MRSATLSEPIASPEGALYEVVNGQRVELPPMGAQSTFIASLLHILLGGHVLNHRLGSAVAEMLFILDAASDLRRRPDVAYVSADRWPLDRPIPATGDWEVVPDLAVEVISPNDVYEDVLAKVGEYFDGGVRQVWVVSPRERRVYVYDSRDAVRIVAAPADLETSLLPGWRLSLATLFRVPQPEGVVPH
jgi:Uma2 family endonuclease